MKKALGAHHLEVGISLTNLAGLYLSQGQYAQAKPIAKRALAIYEESVGPIHRHVATGLYTLALLYKAEGLYAQAEPLFIDALKIRERTLGPDHPDVATIQNELAILYRIQGQYAQAEPLFKRSLAIHEKKLGTDHPDVATSINNFAGFYMEQGLYAQAELLFKRVLKIREKAFGPDHTDVATAINNLAGVYLEQGQYAKAEPLFRKSMEIKQKKLGPDNLDVAKTLNNISSIYKAKGLYGEAEQLQKRSLEIREKILGPDHPDVAISLKNLASLYRAQGNYSLAERLYKRSLDIDEKKLGSDHPSLAGNLTSYALLLSGVGKQKESSLLFERACSIQDINREISFQIMSEKQKRAFMNIQIGTIHWFVSQTAQFMSSSPEAVAGAFNAWLRWKGTLTEAEGRYQEAAARSSDPQISAKLEKLTAIRRELARLRFSKLGKDSVDGYKKSVARIEQQKEEFEAELSRLSKEFALEKNIGRADAKTLATILPKDSIYIDFARTWSFDFKRWKSVAQKYNAFLLIPGGLPEVKLIEISSADSLEELLNRYLKEMNRIKTEGKVPDPVVLNSTTSAIYDLLVKPLEPYLKGKKHIFISPDGNLNLIPFEILTDAENQPLISKYAVSYIGAGRDIVRFTDIAQAKGGALIMADPDYNLGQQEKIRIIDSLKLSGSIRGNIPRNASRLFFDSLPDTKQEADAIARVLTGRMNLKTHNYQRGQALEELLFASESPRILHLATHGYFLGDEEKKAAASIRGLVVKEKDGFEYDDIITIENPMLRSGIALSGVNRSLHEGRDDGMVSAEKILGLRLKGTELVVLSACETGVGAVTNGEGVFGLKRAFILSGAKSLVMSLWSVPSAETTELMTDFYTQMANGRSKANALQQAKLNMMKKKPNPFYWGAFVLTGKPD